MMDVIACILISAGACRALFGVYEFPFAWLSVLLRTAGCTGAMALLSRKWWSLTIAAVGLTLCLGYAVLMDENRALFSFIDWWMDKFPQDSPWFSETGALCVHLLVAAGACLIVFFLLRKFCRIYLLLFLTAALFITLYAFGFDGLLSPLCITLAGIALSLIHI